MILCLAVLIQYRSVTDTHTQTDRQTDTRRRHIPRLARRCAVKISHMTMSTPTQETISMLICRTGHQCIKFQVYTFSGSYVIGVPKIFMDTGSFQNAGTCCDQSVYQI